jgi:hypothetical protein
MLEVLDLMLMVHNRDQWCAFVIMAMSSQVRKRQNFIIR